jgi:hypothetical protein
MVAVLEIKIFSTTIKTNVMLVIGSILLIVAAWLTYEIYRAPLMDDNGNIIKEGKKISDLWRKRR